MPEEAVGDLRGFIQALRQFGDARLKPAETIVPRLRSAVPGRAHLLETEFNTDLLNATAKLEAMASPNRSLGSEAQELPGCQPRRSVCGRALSTDALTVAKGLVTEPSNLPQHR